MSTEEVVAETKMDIEEGHEFVPTSEQAKSDANDYSRFKDIEDSDDEPENKAEGDAGEQLSIDDAITRAISSKEAGNNAFKSGNNAEAKTMYTDGLTALGKFKDIQPPIISEAHANEVRNLLISINGNLAMIFLKEENYSLAISNATEVLNRDEFNVKAYYRRGCAKFRLALYAEAKMDLSKCVEIDPNNGAAKKELADVIKTAKEHAKKEKAAFSGMFSKGSMYDDKEKERKEKIRQKELEEERLRDEWSKSKLERRAEGLPEQTYDEWKKEHDEAAEAKKKEAEKKAEEARKARAKSNESAPRPKPTSTKTEAANDDDEYDAEDAEIIKEATSRGYCYFRKEQSAETKALIGDIAPKAVADNEAAASATVPTGGPVRLDSSEGAAVGTSAWNHAGTWEERDLTVQAKDRVKELCLGTLVDLPVNANNADTQNNVVARITEVKTLEGEAQIVMARGKKRHIYDFSATLEFEIIMDRAEAADEVSDGAAEGEQAEKKKEKRKKKMKGTLSVTDISPTVTPEIATKMASQPKGDYEQGVKHGVDALKSSLIQKIQAFEAEYKAM